MINIIYLCRRFDRNKSSLNSSIVTVVRAELTTPPTYEAQFEVPHCPHDTLQPIALHTMYDGPPVSTHQATPSSDLEMTPPPSPQVSLCTHTPERAKMNFFNANSVVMDTQATHVTSPRTTALYATIPNHTGGAALTRESPRTTALYATIPNHTDGAALTRVSPRTTALYATIPNHTDNAALTRESPQKQFETTKDVEQNSNDSIAMLLTISSRIDDIVKTVESMSARVDLVETQLKMVESSHNSTAVSSDQSTVTNNRAQIIIPESSNIDTPHIPQYKQSVQDLTHCNTHHTPYTSQHTPPNLSPPKFPANNPSLRTSPLLSIHNSSTVPSTPVSGFTPPPCISIT